MTIQFNDKGFALTSGEVTVYVTDNQGVYSHSEQEFVTEGTGLSAGAYLDVPPNHKKGFAIVRSQDGLRWEYIADYRGQLVYSTIDKSEMKITAPGGYPSNTTPIKPHCDLCEWNGSTWVISPENQTALLEQQRQEVRLKINAKRDECVNGGVYVPEINKWVDTDDVGRATLVEIKADFDLNGKDNTYTLICADNSAQPLDFTQFKAVWDAVKNLKEKMFENAYMHKVLLEAENNPENYDYSIGWAKTYQEHLNEQTN